VRETRGRPHRAQQACVHFMITRSLMLRDQFPKQPSALALRPPIPPLSRRPRLVFGPDAAAVATALPALSVVAVPPHRKALTFLESKFGLRGGMAQPALHVCRGHPRFAAAVLVVLPGRGSTTEREACQWTSAPRRGDRCSKRGRRPCMGDSWDQAHRPHTRSGQRGRLKESAARAAVAAADAQCVPV